jgi:hypothetical protein
VILPKTHNNCLTDQLGPLNILLVSIMNKEVSSNKWELLELIVGILVVGAIFLSILVYPKYYIARMVFFMLNMHYFVIGFVVFFLLEKLSRKKGGNYTKLVNYCSIACLLIMLLGPFEYL